VGSLSISLPSRVFTHRALLLYSVSSISAASLLYLYDVIVGVIECMYFTFRVKFAKTAPGQRHTLPVTSRLCNKVSIQTFFCGESIELKPRGRDNSEDNSSVRDTKYEKGLQHQTDLSSTPRSSTTSYLSISRAPILKFFWYKMNSVVS